MNRHNTDTHTDSSRLARRVGLSRQASGEPVMLGGGQGCIGRLRAVAAGLALSALCCAFAPSGALAARVHAASPAFALGGAGAVAGEAGSLSLASDEAGSGVAVNDASHDVYVADTGNRRVDEFDPSKPPAERFIRAWGWGVATGAAELQVCTSTCEPGLAGSEPGEFQAPAYIAVDNGAASASKGAVYVGDPGDDLVTKFDAEGHLVASWGNNGENASHERTQPNGQLNGSPTELFTSGFTVAQIAIEGITVDGSGNLWAYNKHQRLFEFKQDGTWVVTNATFLDASPGPGGISVSSSCEESCDVFVHDGGGRIHVFNPAFVDIGQITSGLAPRRGVAVDASDGDRYVVSEGVLVEDIPAACAPSAVGCAASQVFGEGSLGGATGLAVDLGSGAVFVANAGANQIAVFALALEGNVGAASSVVAHEALLHGTVNPLGVELSSCRFEIGPTLSYGSSAPCAQSVGSIGEGSSPVAVDAPLSGLSGGTAYHFRLHAISTSGNVYSEDATFTTATTAVVREVSASEVSAGGALLQAVVNPEGLSAHYRFEYGACAAAGQCVGSPFTATLPVPDGEIPAGSSDVTLSAPAAGLSAGATYHFRVVVVDANGEALPTPEGTFTFEPPAPGCASARPAADALLGDCRAYEMVTPPDKNGALIDNGVSINDPSIAADGSRVLSMSIQCFHGAESCTAVRQFEGTPFAFTRSEAGWQAESLAPPITANNSSLGYSADTGMALFARSAVPPALEELVAREPDGSLKPIGPVAEAPGAKVGSITDEARAATGDLSRVVYQNSGGLWPSLEAGAIENELLTYPGAVSGRPSLVAVSGDAGSTSLVSACGADLGGNKLIHSLYGPLSSDGRATSFTAKPCATGTGTNAGVEVPAFTLYQRVEDSAGAMKTVLVSGPGPASVCDAACQKAPPRDASFEGASTDGSRVFFTDTGQLANSASDDRHSADSAFGLGGCTEASPVSSGCNLYEFACPAHCDDENERKLVDVSAGDTSGLGSQVQGVLAIPPDGSDVYFVAHGVLTSAANAMGREPVPGAANLYVYRFGAGGGEGQVKFVATLSHADEAQWLDGLGRANVTSDGRFLVFTSHRALTADVSRQEGPAQVYRYDLDTEQLARVSIGRAGFGDNGNASIADALIVRSEADLGIESAIGPARADPTMSDDGQLVFFETPAGLTPGALNDHPVLGNPKALAENVYEWAADGTQPSPDAPACSEPNGCVSLISDGRDLTAGTGSRENQSAVQLLGVDASGENVFFWTADPLVAQDTDSQVDLYDARVGGGFPAPSVATPCATLEACRPAPPAEPLFSSPPSASFSGAGNLLPPPPGPSVKPKPLTRAQQLAKALKVCRKIHSKRKRAACNARARKRYGAKRKPKPTTKQPSRRSRK
jgi:DNA-binding beta-propeller fold protein YncE